MQQRYATWEKVYRRTREPAIKVSGAKNSTRWRRGNLLNPAGETAVPMNSTKFHALLLGTDHTLAESLLPAVRLDGGALGVVSSCGEALKFLQSHTLDIVFLDLQSVEIECLNLLRHLKQH